MSTIASLAVVHGPLLILIIPLIGAALTLASPNARLSWAIAVLAALATAAIALNAGLPRLFSVGPSAFAREGIELSFNGAAAFVAPWLIGVAALVFVAAGAQSNASARATPIAFALALCVLGGWSGALLAPDLITLIAATETAWLAGVGLVAIAAERDKAGLSGAFRMFASGGVASAILLLGAALLARSASADLDVLPQVHIEAPGAAATGAALVLAGLALKAGVAPMHMWFGAAIGRAGSMAVLVLGVIGAVGALAVLVRVAAAAILAPEIGAGVALALAVLGMLSVAVGSMQAIGATNIVRLTVYAGVAQAGCVLLSVALGSPAGFAAALVQLVALGAAALALLAGAAVSGGVTLASLDGLARRAPLASLAITAGALSLMGAPLTLGFLGRWRLIEASVGAEWWWAAAAAIAASLAGVFYGGRLIERVYFRRATETQAPPRDVWRLAVTPALAAGIVVIGIGLAPAGLLNAAAAAAAIMSGAAP